MVDTHDSGNGKRAVVGLIVGLAVFCVGIAAILFGILILFVFLGPAIQPIGRIPVFPAYPVGLIPSDIWARINDDPRLLHDAHLMEQMADWLANSRVPEARR